MKTQRDVILRAIDDFVASLRIPASKTSSVPPKQSAAAYFVSLRRELDEAPSDGAALDCLARIAATGKITDLGLSQRQKDCYMTLHAAVEHALNTTH